jgi:hypothetical protein
MQLRDEVAQVDGGVAGADTVEVEHREPVLPEHKLVRLEVAMDEREAIGVGDHEAVEHRGRFGRQRRRRRSNALEPAAQLR